MTQFQHSMIAMILMFFSWNFFFKQFFITEEEVKEWEEFWKEKLFR